MTKASFYILQSSVQSRSDENLDSQQMRWQFGYRLCKKAMQSGRVTLLCEENDTQALSEFLWSHHAEDFFAHDIDNADAYVNVTADVTSASADVLINLSQKAVLQSKLSRVLEIISPDESCKQTGRERYKAYKASGFVLENHTITV